MRSERDGLAFDSSEGGNDDGSRRYPLRVCDRRNKYYATSRAIVRLEGADGSKTRRTYYCRCYPLLFFRFPLRQSMCDTGIHYGEISAGKIIRQKVLPHESSEFRHAGVGAAGAAVVAAPAWT